MTEENGGDAGQNGAFLSDPVDVIIEKLLRYGCFTYIVQCFTPSTAPCSIFDVYKQISIDRFHLTHRAYVFPFLAFVGHVPGNKWIYPKPKLRCFVYEVEIFSSVNPCF